MAEVYPLIATHLLTVGVYGKLTLPTMLGVNHWTIILPVVLVLGGFLLWIDRRGW